MATIFYPHQRRRTLAIHAGWQRDALAAALIAAAILVIRAPWFGNASAGYDEQLYSLIGGQMLEGSLPFVDLWDRKPFGLFALFAFSHWVLGPDPIAYQALAALFVFGGALCVYALSCKLVDRVSAAVAAVLYVLLLSAYASFSAQSEVFHTPLMVGAVWLLHQPRHPRATGRALLAMLIMGLALQIKYTVLPQCLLLGGLALYSAWLRGTPIGRLAALGAGFALLGLLPTFLVGAYYAGQGELQAFWFANFESFFARAPIADQRLSWTLAYGSVPLWGLAAIGLYAAIGLNPPRDPWLYAVICAWAVSAAASVFLPATVYLYYNGALAAPAVLMAVPLIDRRARAGWLPAGLLLAGMVHIADLPRAWQTTQADNAAMQVLTSAIAPHVDSRSRCLWVHDGPAALYRQTGSCLPTRYIYPDHLNNALERNALGVSQLGEVARILARRPPVIVTAANPVTPQNRQVEALVRRTLAREYRPLVTRHLLDRPVTAWRRIAP